MGKLEDIIKQHNKDLAGSIVKLSDCPFKQAPRVSTGSFSLDIATGGGFPYGSIIEFYGEESTGKSLLALKCIRESQLQGFNCVYIDLEGSITEEWAVKVGVNPDMLYIARPKTAEDALDLMNDLASSGEVGIIVVDSIAALVPVVETESSLKDQQMGVAARLMSKSLRNLTSTLQPSGELNNKDSYNPCSVILINQTREKIGVLYGNPLTTPGGKAAKFYSSIRVHLKRGEVYRDDKKEINGQQIKFQTTKNKTYKPFQVGALSFYYDGHIDNEEAVVQYAVVYDLIEKGGGGNYTFGEDKFKGINRLVEHLKSKPKVLTKLKKDILDLLKKE